MTTSGQDHSHSEHSLNNASQEAALLLDALRKWVDDRGFSVPSMSNVATGSTECKLCPFCQALSLLRESHPEVVEHLGSAAESMLAAVRAVITDHETVWTRATQQDVEQIDIDE